MSGKHLCQSRLSAAYISSNRYMHIILFYFRLFILFSPGLPFIRLSSVFLRSSFVLPSPFIRLFHILHPALFQPSFIFLRSSPFTRPSFSLSTGLSLLPLRHSGSLLRHFLCSLPSFQFSSPSFPALIPRHSRLDRESLSFPLLSPLSFQLAYPHLFQCSPSPPFPLLPPSFQFSPSSFQLLSSSSFPARPGIPVLSTALPFVFPTGLSPSFTTFTLSTIPFAAPVIPVLVLIISTALSPSFPARPGIPCHPEQVILVILSASEGSSPTDFSIIISKHTKI